MSGLMILLNAACAALNFAIFASDGTAHINLGAAIFSSFITVYLITQE